MAHDRRSERRVVVYRAEVLDGSSADMWEVEYEAVSDALHFACRDLREQRRRPIEIVEDGAVVYDAAGIARACEERAEERAEEREEQREEQRAEEREEQRANRGAGA